MPRPDREQRRHKGGVNSSQGRSHGKCVLELHCGKEQPIIGMHLVCPLTVWKCNTKLLGYPSNKAEHKDVMKKILK